MPPKALGGPVLADGPRADDRRARLAAWLTGPDNPFFAKSLANRIWYHLMGRGVVEPVDDFRDSNPASNDELLDGLTADFVKSGFDLRALVRSGEAVQVLLWKLAWQYRKLAEAKKLLAAGRRRFEVTSQLQITFYADEFLRLVDNHTLAELVDKHGEILKADVALKTSGGNEVPILESLVCRLAAPAAR